MLSYETLKNKAREFLAATGLRVEEFQKLLPAFESAYEKCYPSPQALEGTSDLAIDGSERRRQRPKDDELQKGHYSGKKKTHTDKNLLLVNEDTGKVAYLSPRGPGKTHDKKLADEAAIGYPCNATLDKDTGFQGYEPEGVIPRQPKKTQRQAVEYR